jgi:hypothetical protein
VGITHPHRYYYSCSDRDRDYYSYYYDSATTSIDEREAQIRGSMMGGELDI